MRLTPQTIRNGCAAARPSEAATHHVVDRGPGTDQDPQLCQSACAMCRQSDTETDLERAMASSPSGDRRRSRRYGSLERLAGSPSRPAAWPGMCTEAVVEDKEVRA